MAFSLSLFAQQSFLNAQNNIADIDKPSSILKASPNPGQAAAVYNMLGEGKTGDNNLRQYMRANMAVALADQDMGKQLRDSPHLLNSLKQAEDIFFNVFDRAAASMQNAYKQAQELSNQFKQTLKEALNVLEQLGSAEDSLTKSKDLLDGAKENVTPARQESVETPLHQLQSAVNDTIRKAMQATRTEVRLEELNELSGEKNILHRSLRPEPGQTRREKDLQEKQQESYDSERPGLETEQNIQQGIELDNNVAQLSQGQEATSASPGLTSGTTESMAASAGNSTAGAGVTAGGTGAAGGSGAAAAVGGPVAIAAVLAAEKLKQDSQQNDEDEQATQSATKGAKLKPTR